MSGGRSRTICTWVRGPASGAVSSQPTTGARYVFGLSAGAVIALEAALRIPSIAKLALYEPPLETETITQRAWMPRYERELARGDLAAALVTVMKGTADRTALRLVPRALLEQGIRLGGKRSNQSLKAAVDGLAAVLPGARRVTLSGVGHTAADNAGKPELVAAELRSFFAG